MIPQHRLSMLNFRQLMVGDPDYVEAHLAGIWRMVQIRGGIESPQLSSYLKNLLIL